MNISSVFYTTSNAYVGNSAAGLGNSVRTAILLRLVRGKWRLANCLDFLFLFHQGKRKIENNKIGVHL